MYRRLKEPFNGASHFLGAALSVIGLIVLLLAADGRPRHLLAFAIYGVCLVGVYLASGFAHSLHCSPEAAARLERIDYAAIFLMIAGTYTPLCLITLAGPWGIGILIAEWSLALLGTLVVLADRGNAHRLRVLVYMIMGWLVVIAIPTFVQQMPLGGIFWLMLGGAFYSIGAMIYLTDRPNLWPGRFEAHELWHVMVLIATSCHFIVMLAYVA